MPTLLTCALLAEDVYHDRPTIVDGFSPVRVPDNDVYCAGHEFSGGAYAGPQGLGVAGTVSWVPVRGVTFNAPGLAEFAAANATEGTALARANAENVFNFRSEIDVVSRWGRHIGRVYDVAG